MDKVCDWLVSLGPQYGQYDNLFEAQGWDDMDNVATMSETDIQTLGITKPGHLKKLKLAIKQLKEQEQYDQPSPNSGIQNAKTEQKQDIPIVKTQNEVYTANDDKGVDAIQGATCCTNTILAGAEKVQRRDLADLNIVTDDITNKMEHFKCDTALALNHDSETDESSSDSDEGISESSNAVMFLPPSHVLSTQKHPIVAQLNSVSSSTVHKTMIVKDSKNVTIAKKVENHIHEHTDKGKDNFKGQIKTVIRNYKRTEHLFVETRAYKEVSDILEDSNWAVIIGNAGYGKSTMALHQMLEHSRKGYEPIIVTSVTDWKLMIEGQGKESRKQCVLIDDIFGSLSVNDTKLNDWISMFDMINKLVRERKGGLKVICTTRKYIFSQVSTKLKQFKLFGTLNIVDLTEDQYELLQTEKSEMLTKNFKHYKIKTEETFIDSVSKIASDYGFPHCVEMFGTSAKFRERGLAFFRKPLELLKKEIDYLVDFEKNQFCSLLIVLLSQNNEFNIEDLDKHRTDVKAISDALKLLKMRENTYLPDFISIFKILNNVYIKEIKEGIYTFKHDSFKEIISIVAFKFNPALSLDLMDLDIIVEVTKYCTYKPSLQEMVVVLPKSCTVSLIKRFNKEIQAGYHSYVTMHQAWHVKDFIDKWLLSIKRLPNSINSYFQTFYVSKEGDHGQLMFGFLPQLCIFKKEEAVILILQDNDFRNLYNSKEGINELSITLLLACTNDCSEQLLEVLIHHGADVNMNLEANGHVTEGKAVSSVLENVIQMDNLELCKYLISKGVSLFCFGINQKHIINIAAESGSTKCLQYFLVYLNSLTLPSYLNKKSKDFKIIEYLYGGKYSSFFCNLQNKIPSHVIDMYSCIEKTNWQLNKYVVQFEIYNYHSMMPMLLLTGKLTPDLIDILVEHCVNVKMQVKQNNQPLIFFVIDVLRKDRVNYPDNCILKSLYEHGLNINAINFFGQTALSYILCRFDCECLPTEIIFWLLDMKADPNIPDDKGNVPLFYALQKQNNMPTMRMLLKQTKKLGNIVNNNGRNCFHFLAQNCKLTIKSVEEIMSLLQVENIDINHLANNGISSLALTNLQTIEPFLRNAADPNIYDENGRNPVMPGLLISHINRVLPQSNTHIFKKMCILVKNGMVINAKDRRGQNIAHYVLQHTFNDQLKIDIVKLYLKESCDINEKDYLGQTPLMLAIRNVTCSLLLLNFLIENGADVSSIDHSGMSVIDHCLESLMNDLQKSELIKNMISTQAFPGVKAWSVTYALTGENGVHTLSTVFNHVSLQENNIVQILEQIVASTKCDQLKAIMITLCFDRFADGTLSKDKIDTDMHANLLKSEQVVKLFIKHDLINMNVYKSNKIDVKMLPNDDHSASKVLNILEQNGICLEKVLTCSEEPVEMKFAKEGKYKSLCMMLKYWDKDKALFRDSKGNTVLHYLAMLESEVKDVGQQAVPLTSNNSIIQIFNTTGFPCVQNEKGETALHAACQKQPLKQQTLLLMRRNEQQVNTVDNLGMTAMHHLVKKNVYICETSTKQQDTWLGFFLNQIIHHGASVDLRDKNGQTPVMCLLANKFVNRVPNSVKVLLSSVKDFSKLDIYGNNILHYLCDSYLDDEIKHIFIQMMINKGAKMNAANKLGSTPADMCQRFCAFKTVCTLEGTDTENVLLYLVGCIEWFPDIHKHPEELIVAINQAKLDVNATSHLVAPYLEKRITLLSQSCRFYSDTKIVYALLLQGANPNLRDKSGFTSVHWLLFSGKMMLFSILKCYCFHEDVKSEFLFQLRNKHPWEMPINMKNHIKIQKKQNELSDDLLSIHTSIMEDVNIALNILNILLRNKADPNIMDNKGRSPLHYCAMSPIIDGFTCVAMQMLMDFGADVNLEDNNGQTPLMLCAASERTKHRRLNILIKAGANLLAVDYNGRQISDHTQVCICKLLQEQFKIDPEEFKNFHNSSLA